MVITKVLLEQLKKEEVKIKHGTLRKLMEINIMLNAIHKIEEPDIYKLFQCLMMVTVLLHPRNIMEAEIKNGT